jgi:hypothetical protein
VKAALFYRFRHGKSSALVKLKYQRRPVACLDRIEIIADESFDQRMSIAKAQIVATVRGYVQDQYKPPSVVTQQARQGGRPIVAARVVCHEIEDRHLARLYALQAIPQEPFIADIVT